MFHINDHASKQLLGMQPAVHGIAAETLKKEGHSVAEAQVLCLLWAFSLQEHRVTFPYKARMVHGRVSSAYDFQTHLKVSTGSGPKNTVCRGLEVA